MGWNCLSSPKLQWLHHWSLGMDKYIHSTFYWVCDYLSMLGLKLNHVSKRGYWYVNHSNRWILYDIICSSTFVRFWLIFCQCFMRGYFSLIHLSHNVSLKYHQMSLSSECWLTGEYLHIFCENGVLMHWGLDMFQRKQCGVGMSNCNMCLMIFNCEFE